ncbi:MAG: bifunctional metallophosphatase/5'-nucleotidase [Candidatus Aminicenantes bacterium]|nr:MAG: bifunctional metallophosphatase/5'-nucleotidase [Candidatus Aminicenantes bacterium]
MKRKKGPLLVQHVLCISILVGLILPCIQGCGKPEPGWQYTGETRIILFHVNDMHARINNIARIAWYVQQEKKRIPKASVFFLNAGDNFSGNAVVDQYDPKGEPILQLMYRMGYDAMVLGNHEFDYRQQVLKRFIEKANFPIICANANLKGEKESFPQPPPFTILKTSAGIKIAVLGLIEVNKHTSIPDTHPNGVKGFTFSHPIETAKKYRYLKKESHVFIALTHLGIDTDELLAQEMGELDLIIGGHSHSQIHHPFEINGVMIAQAGGNARYLGRIELILKEGQLVKKSGKLIEVATIKGKIPQLEEMIVKFNNSPVLNQVIAVLPRSLPRKYEVGNLLCDALRKHFNLDIVFHNYGGIRVNQLGPIVKLKDIYDLHPFENRMVQFEMTPAEIRSLIQSSYERYNKLDLLVSGIAYIVKRTSRGEVKDVELRDETGELLDETKTYTVGMNDFMASTYEFIHRDPGKSLMVTVNDAFIQYLKQEKDVCKGIKGIRTLESTPDKNEGNRKKNNKNDKKVNQPWRSYILDILP